MSAASPVFVEDPSSLITYSRGGWTTQYWGGYHGSSVKRTSQLGDWAAFSFKGKSISLMGAQGWDHGTFRASLDGADTDVDAYFWGGSLSNQGGQPQVVQFQVDDLGPGYHTLNITNLEAGPYGSVFELDALVIIPHPATTYSPRATFLAAGVFVLLLSITLSSVFRALLSRRKLARRPFGRHQVREALLANDDLLDGEVDLDDHAVERIAQRVAAVMRAENDAPPVYSTEATKH
ncbi:hypothetical protein FIBSPDRAFT_924191 [Athelia psychrophila]|uniref:Uncharacterized protein n=1 Tax=Athelia psychrophila TaxID=1759441 RepID=A0A166WGC4_9AGAM|nr:hypothetical protein FIBSPDRAFT_924191 [Fibularhizoctonia sp. CBS 109695]